MYWAKMEQQMQFWEEIAAFQNLLKEFRRSGPKMHGWCCKREDFAGIARRQAATKQMSNLGYEVKVLVRLTVCGKVRFERELSNISGMET